MNQRGIFPIYIILLLIIGVIGIFIYAKRIPTTKSVDSTTNTQNQATPSASLTATASPTVSRAKTVVPLPKSPSPRPTLVPTSVPTSNPTSVPAPVVPKNTCDVNIIYGKMGGGASDPLLVTLAYGFTGHNNVYMTGAQWDFDGNGTWDTDLKQLNGTMEHTYPQAGTYTPRLQLQASDGSMTDVCSKSLTVPSGVTVRLTGKVYADINCNTIPEPNEKGVAGANVLITKMPEYSTYATLTTDNDGNYNFSQNIQPNDALSLSPGSGPVPSGYKSNPHFTEHTFALNSSQSSINVDIPIVPYDNLGACQ